ncbi:MAG: YHS domain-containing protein [Chloroflexi bacterium]|nr:YHS domain-containing protein [Chloroflexota bacterium]
MATDPVCQMEVDMKKPNGGTFEYNGVTYYFCAMGCNRAFQREPEAYLSGEKQIHM